MFSINKVLVPVAFSPNCCGAIRYAAAVACHFRSELILLHVLKPLGAALGFEIGLHELAESRRAWFRRELEEFSCEQLLRLPTRRVLAEGDAATEIVGFADSEHADLIAMPTHGYGPFRRLLIGSVTAKVLHDTRCAVWTGVHLETAPLPERIGFSTIACAVDLGPQTTPAMEWAAGMAAAWPSRLVVVHVLEAAHDERRRHQLMESAHTELQKRAAGLQMSVEIRVEFGDVPEVVCAAAKQSEADLLVIGRGHRVGGGRLPCRAYAIVRESPCPVVSV